MTSRDRPGLVTGMSHAPLFGGPPKICQGKNKDVHRVWVVVLVLDLYKCVFLFVCLNAFMYELKSVILEINQ